MAAIHIAPCSSTKGTTLSFARSQTRSGVQFVLAYCVRLPTVHVQKPGSEPVSASTAAPNSRPAAMPAAERATAFSHASRRSRK